MCQGTRFQNCSNINNKKCDTLGLLFVNFIWIWYCVLIDRLADIIRDNGDKYWVKLRFTRADFELIDDATLLNRDRVIFSIVCFYF